ncbi:MAG TPA: histidine kinase [Burkholderiaceae bacterium]|nr:histidine kinase [Burkholderiaceae bacterium]HQR71489.1 histidine kinase [Burkholderiaceae bacterium]
MKSESAYLTEADPGLTPALAPGDVESSASSVLTEFLGLVVRLTGARAGAIRAPTADSLQLRLIASVGLASEHCAVDSLMPANCGMCGAALQSALTRQATRRVGCKVLDAQNSAGGEHGRAVAVPLDHREKPIGVLNLFFSEGHDPPAGITHLLRPFGQLLGLALENERLTRENLQTRVAQERQSMAADIHDALAQSLTFVRMRMSLLHDALETSDLPTARTYWTDASDELRNAHGRLREMISMYRAGLDSRGLLASLGELAAVFRRRTGIELLFDSRVSDFNFGTEQQLQVFYIVQEALANISKHSGARHARILVDRDGSDLRVVVEDDGRGPGEEMLDPRVAGRLTEAGHHGLQIMRERAGRAGGRLHIGVLPNGGTRITLTVDGAAGDGSR